MDILKTLENRVPLAQYRDYLTGEAIAKETLEIVKRDAFSVFEVLKLRHDANGRIEKAETKIFMTKSSADDYASNEANRICKLNKHYDQWQDGNSVIEIEYVKKERLVYVIEVIEKEVV